MVGRGPLVVEEAELSTAGVTKKKGYIYLNKNRESSRIKDANSRRVLDDASRQRRVKQALEALYSDNFHEDPHGDLVANKKAPKFQDTLNPKDRKGRRQKTSEYYKFKYRKTLGQMIEIEETVRGTEGIKFTDLTPPPSNFPPRNFCAVCGYFSTYKCTTCGAKFCSIECNRVHLETRCLKWTS